MVNAALYPEDFFQSSGFFLCGFTGHSGIAGNADYENKESHV